MGRQTQKKRSQSPLKIKETQPPPPNGQAVAGSSTQPQVHLRNTNGNSAQQQPAAKSPAKVIGTGEWSPDAGKQSDYACGRCAKAFRYKIDRWKHMERDHPESAGPKPENDRPAWDTDDTWDSTPDNFGWGNTDKVDETWPSASKERTGWHADEVKPSAKDPTPAEAQAVPRAPSKCRSPTNEVAPKSRPTSFSEAAARGSQGTGKTNEKEKDSSWESQVFSRTDNWDSLEKRTDQNGWSAAPDSDWMIRPSPAPASASSKQQKRRSIHSSVTSSPISTPQAASSIRGVSPHGLQMPEDGQLVSLVNGQRVELVQPKNRCFELRVQGFDQKRRSSTSMDGHKNNENSSGMNGKLIDVDTASTIGVVSEAKDIPVASGFSNPFNSLRQQVNNQLSPSESVKFDDIRAAHEGKSVRRHRTSSVDGHPSRSMERGRHATARLSQLVSETTTDHTGSRAAQDGSYSDSHAIEDDRDADTVKVTRSLSPIKHDDSAQGSRPSRPDFIADARLSLQLLNELKDVRKQMEANFALVRNDVAGLERRDMEASYARGRQDGIREVLEDYWQLGPRAFQQKYGEAASAA